jgi:protein SCO1/2
LGRDDWWLIVAKSYSSISGLVVFLALAVIVASCAQGIASGELQGRVVDPPQPKPSFTLTDTSGEPYDFAAETHGRLTLLYFGYLNCPDICPVHLAQIAEVFDQIADVARDTEVVFVSVDPDRDSPEEIRAFLDNFDSRFVGLTGSHDELEDAQKAAGVPTAVLEGEGDDYTVDHAGWVIAYGPDGLSHANYPFGIRQSEWANDLQILAGMDGS